MSSFQNYSSTAAHSPAKTSLKLKGDRKVIFINHPDHGQHSFSLPTKEEILQDYGESDSDKKDRKKWCNSFMIFRAYLQRSKTKNSSDSDVKDVSKFAKFAWNNATREVKEACNELEAELRGTFKFKTFVQCEISKNSEKTAAKKRKTTKTTTKERGTTKKTTKEGETTTKKRKSATEERVTITKKRKSTTDEKKQTEELVYPSPSTPSITVTPIVFSPLMYSPASIQPLPTRAPNVPSLILGPPLSPQELEILSEEQLSSSQTSSLTPSQIFLHNTSSFPLMTDINSFEESTSILPNITAETIPIQTNETATESENISYSFQLMTGVNPLEGSTSTLTNMTAETISIQTNETVTESENISYSFPLMTGVNPLEGPTSTLPNMTAETIPIQTNETSENISVGDFICELFGDHSSFLHVNTSTI